MKDYCNKVYSDLCARLGDLYIQKRLIDQSIESILHQLDLLNCMSPELQKLEKKEKENA